MLQLLALAPEDGWAYVRQGDHVYLVRPPYRQSNRRDANERDVVTAAADYGFQRDEQSFGSWGELIEYLRRRIVERRPELAEATPGSLGMRVLETADADALTTALGFVRKDLIDKGKVDSARRVLIAILKLPAACGNGALHSQAVELLAAVDDRARRMARELAAANGGLATPLADAKYGRPQLDDFSRHIARDGVWALAS